MIGRGKLMRSLFIGLAAVLMLAMLTGCGSSSNSGSDNKDTTEKAEPVEKDPVQKFIGTWRIAAAESEGVTMSGNFGELIGASDKGTLKIDKGGTGEMSLDEDKVSLKWETLDDDTIKVTPEKKTDLTGESVDVKYKDDALFMGFEQDGKKANAIFTKDSNYKGAKEIKTKDAKPITDESSLIGKWEMSAMRILGVSVYGDPKDLREISGGQEIFVTFEKDGKAEMNGQSGTWSIGKKGAVLTSKGLSGSTDSPIMSLGDVLLIDFSEQMGGNEFICVMTKTE